MSGYDKKNLQPRSTSLFYINKRNRMRELGTEVKYPNDLVSHFNGLKNHANRLHSYGGYDQQERMIFDKRRSLDRALLFSYQSAAIKKVQCSDDINNAERPNIHALDEHKICRALINPNKLKLDYDDKILSVHYEENFHAGDIFEWMGTDTHWLIYLQDLDETAYFRGEIRKCSYELEWEDEDGRHRSYVAVRGPVETKIDYIQKHGISVDNPNYSLSILMPRNEETMSYFRRYSKFYLQDIEPGAPNVCWRVEAVDWISSPGILEVTAVEYYANKDEDDFEEGIAGCLIKKAEDPNNKKDNVFIKGETFIKPKEVVEYHFTGLNPSSWIIVEGNNVPVDYIVNPDDASQIRIIWKKSYSGQFTLKNGDYEKTIVVQSLF